MQEPDFPLLVSLQTSRDVSLTDSVLAQGNQMCFVADQGFQLNGILALLYQDTVLYSLVVFLLRHDFWFYSVVSLSV